MTRLLLVVLVSCTAAGCAVGREHSYHTLNPRVMSVALGEGVVALAVRDRRAEVRSGAKDPDFVGVSHAGYGFAFDITTASDAPLAADLTAAIQRSLQSARYQVRAVPITHDTDAAQMLVKLSSTGASALLLLQVHRLKSDTYKTTGLQYQLEAVVMDRERHVLGYAIQEGEEQLGGSLWAPSAYADKVVPFAVEQKLELLLNDPLIAEALYEALSSEDDAPLPAVPQLTARRQEATARAAECRAGVLVEPTLHGPASSGSQAGHAPRGGWKSHGGGAAGPVP